MTFKPHIPPMVGATCAKMLLNLSEAAAVRGIILPAFFGMRRGAVGTVMAVALTLLALAYIGFEVRVIELRIMSHQAAFDTAGIAFHCVGPPASQITARNSA